MLLVDPRDYIRCSNLSEIPSCRLVHAEFFVVLVNTEFQPPIMHLSHFLTFLLTKPCIQIGIRFKDLAEPFSALIDSGESLISHSQYLLLRYLLELLTKSIWA